MLNGAITDMKKFIMFVICIISIFTINGVCVNAKEPEKTTCTLYFGNAKQTYTEGYVIDGEDYYRIDSIFSINYGRPDTEQVNVRFNEEENCIEAYYTKFTSVPAKNIMTATPMFQVYEVKKPESGTEQVFWATHDLETGEKNAYVTKDPFIYMRDKIYKPHMETIKVKTVDGNYKNIVRYAIYKSYYYKIDDLVEILKCTLD